ncbi:MAG TPA: hypothetical protein VK849_02810 [Longimicrobiales bacterium]|nr:hypothetical protein [Longimicrobiales bacterium]
MVRSANARVSRRRRRGGARALAALVALGAVACSDAAGPDTEMLGRFVSVAAGSTHACALNEGGEVFCWGSNEQGQLSVPGGGFQSRPVLARLGADVEAVTAALDFTCSVERDGDVVCWGDGRLGQLGWGQLFSSLDGEVVSGGPADAVSAGGHHACMLRGPEVSCWGADRYGASLGSRTDAQSRCVVLATGELWPCVLTPTALDTPRAFAEVTAGLWHTCARGAAGSVWCWGANTLGQLGAAAEDECVIEDRIHGDARFPCNWDPRPVGFAEPVTTVRAGGGHSCAIGASAALYCWGLDVPIYGGQLGYGGAVGSRTPVRVQGAQGWSAVAVSPATIFASTCALTLEGEAWCWGVGRLGGLGAEPQQTCPVGGGAPCALTPVRVDTQARFTDIAVGDEFACGVTTEQRILCWGANERGQLGDGTVTSRSEPRPITGFGWDRPSA